MIRLISKKYMNFYLSSKALRQFKEAGLKNDFEIKIFDDTIYCSTFVAIFISGRISKNHRIDPTMRRFTINFPDKSLFYSNIKELKSMIQQTDFIKQFRNLLEGRSIYFDSDENDQEDTDDIDKAKLFIEIGQILENKEMIDKGLEVMEIDFTKSDISIEEAIEMIKINHKIFCPKINKRSYEIISSNFYSILQNEDKKIISILKEMSQEELETIFSSQKLQIDNEDSLFELITNLGPDYYFLYDYIEFEYLSIEKVEQFINNISNHEVSLHPLLWSSICRRLMIDVTKGKENFYNKQRHKKPKNKVNQIINCEKGIIKYLTELTENDNIYISKIIDVEVSEVESGKIKNIFDQSKNTLLRVKDPKNSFIVIDFKDKKVNLSKYYFSVPDVKGIIRNHPNSWEIEGSNDKQDWEKIDERSNESSFSYYGASKTFTCQNRNDKFYRFIRIKEIIGQNNGHELLLSEVEFYVLVQPN